MKKKPHDSTTTTAQRKKHRPIIKSSLGPKNVCAFRHAYLLFDFLFYFRMVAFFSFHFLFMPCLFFLYSSWLLAVAWMAFTSLCCVNMYKIFEYSVRKAIAVKNKSANKPLNIKMCFSVYSYDKGYCCWLLANSNEEKLFADKAAFFTSTYLSLVLIKVNLNFPLRIIILFCNLIQCIKHEHYTIGMPHFFFT